MPVCIKMDLLVVEKDSSNSGLLMWRVRVQRSLIKSMLGLQPDLTGMEKGPDSFLLLPWLKILFCFVFCFLFLFACVAFWLCHISALFFSM